ncbi:MAG: hypothetical protein KF813_04655 [Trueperaceae bacterium]|nr:hypothetical protein [Trueperaceae bacterium]
MAYLTHLYTPETYEGFSNSSRNLAGFPKSQAKTIRKLNRGDILIGYMTKLSRWIGAHRVLDGPFEDDTPVFTAESDRYVLRFHIEPIVWLQVQHGVPIHEDHVWDRLSFTQGLPKSSKSWTGKVRRSLVDLPEIDGDFLLHLLRSQAEEPHEFPYDRVWYESLLPKSVNTVGGRVSVVVPLDSEEEPLPIEEHGTTPSPRDSHRVQSVLARIGELMGFKIWLPRNDRRGVIETWQPSPDTLLDVLPLNYDDVTLKTVEQIDVIWLKGRSIVRAFEVEHTTAVYSGILRMADLLALQPNMDIKLHIVAPVERKDRVMAEIRRPVFSLLEKGQLKDYCTFISYDSLFELANMPHLGHLSDSVLEEYEEEAA